MAEKKDDESEVNEKEKQDSVTSDKDEDKELERWNYKS